MIRPFTLICVVLAGGSGLYLYQSKHRAQMLDREIGRTVSATAAIRDRIGLLKAEWALLNEPERLQDLAQQHLALKPLAPTQYVGLADLGQRLPPALPPGALLPPPEDPPVIADTQPLPAPPAVVTATAAASASAPAARAAGPVQLARVMPRHVPDVPIAADSAPLSPAIATPPDSAAGRARKPFTPITPLGPATPLVPRPVLVQRVVATSPAPVPFAFPTPPVTISALGGAGHVALPPPVPVH